VKKLQPEWRDRDADAAAQAKITSNQTKSSNFIKFAL